MLQLNPKAAVIDTAEHTASAIGVYRASVLWIIRVHKWKGSLHSPKKIARQNIMDNVDDFDKSTIIRKV